MGTSGRAARRARWVAGGALAVAIVTLTACTGAGPEAAPPAPITPFPTAVATPTTVPGSGASTAAVAATTPSAAASAPSSVALSATGAAGLAWGQAGARQTFERLLGPADRADKQDLAACGLPGVFFSQWGAVSVFFEGDQLFAWTVGAGEVPPGVTLPAGVSIGDPLARVLALPGASTPTYDDVRAASFTIVDGPGPADRLIFLSQGSDSGSAVLSISAPNTVACD